MTGMPPDRLFGARLDCKAEAGREAHGPQQAQVIFLEALLGITDGANQARLDIVLSTDVVDDAILDRVKEETVDGEIAPAGIFLGVGEMHLGGPPSVQVFSLGTEG